MTIAHHITSRRDFLGQVAAGACSLAALSHVPLGAAESPAKSKMRFGLCTFTWGKDWDIPALIANCQKAGIDGVEPRTSSKYAHGIEITLNAQERAEVKKRFADSPVRLVSIASGERFDWPEPEKLRAAIQGAKEHLKLSHDLGCNVVRVFPNQFHRDVPHETTIEQIARAVNEVGAFADGVGQEVSLEAHGPAGELSTMRAVMDRVTQRSVRIRLNCSARDAQGDGFVANFNLVKDYLSKIIHLHSFAEVDYPYQLMVDLLVKAKWEGYALAERADKVDDRVAAMAEQRKAWEAMIDKAIQAGG